MNQKSKQIRIIDIDKLDVYKNKRNCYSEIEDFVNSHKGTKGQICALYGLLSTGKTELLQQIAKELHEKGHKCLYLSCSDEYENIIKDRSNNVVHRPEIEELYELLDQAIKEDYNYVFIDELTLVKDFVGQSNVLSNFYANQGLNIIVTGTDSLSFVLAAQDGLMDRLKPIHTSYVSFEEYNKLLGKGLDEYIQSGGTLKKESPYKNHSTMIEYTDKAIVNNIIHSINGFEHCDSQAITLLYPEADIKSTINSCIKQINQDFIISNVVSLAKLPKDSFAIPNKNELPIQMDADDIERIKNTFKDLELVLTVPTYKSVSDGFPVQDTPTQILSQSGMIYCHAAELIKLLVNDENWKQLEKCGLGNKQNFIDIIDRQVKGAILKNLIIYDTYKALNENYYVTKIRRHADGKEVALAIVDKQSKDTYLFEVKYSQHKVGNEAKNLADEDFSDYIEEKFGKIKGRYVLYTGENDRIDSPFGEINFFSAELFLKSVVKAKTVENLLALLDKSQG